MLIGGTAQVINGVQNITASALNLEVLTDAASEKSESVAKLVLEGIVL